jgi:hypothetical protein
MEVNGMTEKEIQMAKYRVTFENSIEMNPEEVEVWLKASSVMFDLGWPIAPRDSDMCAHALAGTLTPYAGYSSILDFQAERAKERMAERLRPPTNND